MSAAQAITQALTRVLESEEGAHNPLDMASPNYAPWLAGRSAGIQEARRILAPGPPDIIAAITDALTAATAAATEITGAQRIAWMRYDDTRPRDASSPNLAAWTAIGHANGLHLARQIADREIVRQRLDDAQATIEDEGRGGPLLTLHTDRFDRLTPALAVDGHRLAGHWYLQEAVNQEVITWDRDTWGNLLLGVEPVSDEGNLLELAVFLTISDELTLTRGIESETPDNFNDLSADEQNELKLYPDPTHETADYLRLVVDELNELAAAAERMVAAWPGTTRQPLIT